MDPMVRGTAVVDELLQLALTNEQVAVLASLRPATHWLTLAAAKLFQCWDTQTLMSEWVSERVSDDVLEIVQIVGEKRKQQQQRHASSN